VVVTIVTSAVISYNAWGVIMSKIAEWKYVCEKGSYSLFDYIYFHNLTCEYGTCIKFDHYILLA